MSIKTNNDEKWVEEVVYLVERYPVFHEWVGLLWTEKLAWQMDVLNGLEGLALKRLRQKLRGEEQQASLTVINIIIHKLSSLAQRRRNIETKIKTIPPYKKVNKNE